MPWLVKTTDGHREKIVLVQQRVKVGQTVRGENVIESKFVRTTGRDFSVLGDLVEIPVPTLICPRCNYEYYPTEYKMETCTSCGLGVEFMEQRPSVFTTELVRRG